MDTSVIPFLLTLDDLMKKRPLDIKVWNYVLFQSFVIIGRILLIEIHNSKQLQEQSTFRLLTSKNIYNQILGFKKLRRTIHFFLPTARHPTLICHVRRPIFPSKFNYNLGSLSWSFKASWEFRGTRGGRGGSEGEGKEGKSKGEKGKRGEGEEVGWR